jgi:hypothetical protein
MSDISIAMGLMSVLAIGFIALMRVGFGHAKTHKLINVCIALLLTYFLFKYFKQLNWIPVASTALQKTLAVSSAVVAATIAFKFSLDAWRRLHMSIIVGALIFIFFPVMLANNHAPTIYWPSPSNQSPTLKATKLPTQNTMLDCMWLTQALILLEKIPSA